MGCIEGLYRNSWDYGVKLINEYLFWFPFVSFFWGMFMSDQR